MSVQAENTTSSKKRLLIFLLLCLVCLFLFQEAYAKYRKYATVNVSALNVFENGATVSLETLVACGIVRKEFDGLKVLGNGELTKQLNVEAKIFTASAKEKIEAAGGKAEVK